MSVHSPALLDLGHGTVRHRDIAREQTNPDVPSKTKTGYFYHPKLDDYSEGWVEFLTHVLIINLKHNYTKCFNCYLAYFVLCDMIAVRDL